jgi:hypothetical protein
MTIRTAYSYHALRAITGGYSPLTLRQFVALRAAMAFGGAL